MSSAPKKLTAKQERALVHLLSERTTQLAAEKAGVSYATLRRWLAEPAFVAAYREVRRHAVEQATGRLQRAASRAVAALVRNLTCGQASTEVRAAAAVLEMAFKGVELADLAEQLEQLKAALEGRNQT
jgi:hypothetical protein